MNSDLAKSAKHLGRLAGGGREAKVKLHNLGAIDAASIFDGESCGEGGDIKSQPSVFKGGVAETMTESEGRRHIVSVIPASAVSDKNTRKRKERGPTSGNRQGGPR